MTISVIYHVEVAVPAVVSDYLDLDKPEYFQAVCNAQEGNVAAGADTFADKFDWADFTTLAEAQACEKALTELFQSWVPLAEAIRLEREQDDS